jgi:hypothetical protein
VQVTGLSVRRAQSGPGLLLIPAALVYENPGTEKGLCAGMRGAPHPEPMPGPRAPPGADLRGACT